MEVLDSFQRANENPLSDGGKWSRLWTTGTEPTGKISEEAWNQITSGNLEGAFWNVAEFGKASEPDAAVEIHKLFTEGEWIDLHVCLGEPTVETWNGYYLRVEEEATAGKFKFYLVQRASAAETLATTTSVAITAGDRVGVSARSGNLVAWHKSGGGVWVEVVTATATHIYPAGYVGFTARTQGGQLRNFEVSS